MSSYSLPQTFRTTSHRWAALGVWGVAAVMVGLVAASLDWGQTLRWACVCAMFSLWTWILLWQPHVRVDRDSIHISNPFYTLDVEPQAVSEVSTQYQFAVVVNDRRHYAWALPAPGFLAGANMGLKPGQQRTGPVTQRGALVQARPGDLSGSGCGTASEVTRSILPEHPTTTDTAVVQTINWKLIAFTVAVTFGVFLV